ncbi:MAG: MFS transporter [Phycisphaerae bacterium]
MKSDNINTISPAQRWMLLRALRYRNYRLFFGGQAVSLIGTWMQLIATGWLVYRMTHSAFLLGVVTFAGQIPSFFVIPFGGLVADRWNRRRMLVITQILSMVQAFVLTILYYTGWINIGWIIVLTVLLGLVNAFDIPIRYSFVLEMVEKKEDLGNAIALNASIFNGARLIGPSIAGLLVASMGEGVCFLVNAVSYIAVIAALLAMRITVVDKKSANGHVLEGLKEGFKYVTGFAPIRAILLLLCLICLLPYQVLLPVFAEKILMGTARTYGFLMGGTGLGALAGALFLASRPSTGGLGKIMVGGGVIYGAGLIILAFLHHLHIALLLTVVIGFGMMIVLAASNTILQTISDDDKRGRVMSFYTMSFMGTSTVGSLLGGLLAQAINISNTYLICGLLSVAGSAIFAAKLTALVKLSRESVETSSDERRSL